MELAFLFQKNKTIVTYRRRHLPVSILVNVCPIVFDEMLPRVFSYYELRFVEHIDVFERFVRAKKTCCYVNNEFDCNKISNFFFMSRIFKVKTHMSSAESVVLLELFVITAGIRFEMRRSFVLIELGEIGI